MAFKAWVLAAGPRKILESLLRQRFLELIRSKLEGSAAVLRGPETVAPPLRALSAGNWGQDPAELAAALRVPQGGHHEESGQTGRGLVRAAHYAWPQQLRLRRKTKADADKRISTPEALIGNSKLPHGT